MRRASLSFSRAVTARKVEMISASFCGEALGSDDMAVDRGCCGEVNTALERCGQKALNRSGAVQRCQ